MAYPHNATIHLVQPLKSKAKRERASWQQKLILEKIFESNQYPDLTIRTQLSDQLGMSPRKIQIWFQNRRTKAKQKNPKEDGAELDINEPLKDGNTYLAVACSQGHSLVPKILAKGAKPNITNENGFAPLHFAVLNGHVSTVEILTKKENNCNVNMREQIHGETPLHLASLKKNVAIAKILLKDENINVNIRDHENYTPLHHACINGSLEIAELLLKKAEVNVISAEGFTPLHCAALNGNDALVSALIAKGANLNFCDNLGYNALAFAVREGHVKAAAALIAAKANLNARIMEDDLSIMHIAVLRNNREMIELLIAHGASARAVNKKFQNAVHLAAQIGDPATIQMLIDKGVDDFSKDSLHKSPADYAINNNHAEARALLEKYCAPASPQSTPENPAQTDD